MIAAGRAEDLRTQEMSELASRSIFAGLLAALWVCARDPVVYHVSNVIIHGLMIGECAVQLKSKEWSALCLLGVVAYKYAVTFQSLSRDTVLTYIAMCAISDIAQYVVGKNCGRKHLFLWISPSKTLEGYLGGLVSVLLVVPLFNLAVPDALWIFISAVAGDLCASAFKRTFQIKHFSPILAGHGGVLDRFDSYVGVVILS